MLNVDQPSDDEVKAKSDGMTVVSSEKFESSVLTDKLVICGGGNPTIDDLEHATLSDSSVTHQCKNVKTGSSSLVNNVSMSNVTHPRGTTIRSVHRMNAKFATAHLVDNSTRSNGYSANLTMGKRFPVEPSIAREYVNKDVEMKARVINRLPWTLNESVLPVKSNSVGLVRSRSKPSRSSSPVGPTFVQSVESFLGELSMTCVNAVVHTVLLPSLDLMKPALVYACQIEMQANVELCVLPLMMHDVIVGLGVLQVKTGRYNSKLFVHVPSSPLTTTLAKNFTEVIREHLRSLNVEKLTIDLKKRIGLQMNEICSYLLYVAHSCAIRQDFAFSTNGYMSFMEHKATLHDGFVRLNQDRCGECRCELLALLKNQPSREASVESITDKLNIKLKKVSLKKTKSMDTSVNDSTKSCELPVISLANHIVDSLNVDENQDLVAKKNLKRKSSLRNCSMNNQKPRESSVESITDKLNAKLMKVSLETTKSVESSVTDSMLSCDLPVVSMPEHIVESMDVDPKQDLVAKKNLKRKSSLSNSSKSNKVTVMSNTDKNVPCVEKTLQLPSDSDQIAKLTKSSSTQSFPSSAISTVSTTAPQSKAQAINHTSQRVPGDKLSYGLFPEPMTMALRSISGLYGRGLNGWLSGETIYAYCSVIAGCQGMPSSCIIDPNIAYSTYNIGLATTHPNYPLPDQEYYLPMLVSDRSHWVVAVCRPASGEAVIYDSFQHTRNSLIIPRDQLDMLDDLWSFCFNRILVNVESAPLKDIPKQRDGYNCGVHACFTIFRLIRKLQLDATRFTDACADRFREAMARQIKANFHVVDEDGPFDSERTKLLRTFPEDGVEMVVSTQEVFVWTPTNVAPSPSTVVAAPETPSARRLSSAKAKRESFSAEKSVVRPVKVKPEEKIVPMDCVEVSDTSCVRRMPSRKTKRERVSAEETQQQDDKVEETIDVDCDEVTSDIDMLDSSIYSLEETPDLSDAVMQICSYVEYLRTTVAPNVRCASALKTSKIFKCLKLDKKGNPFTLLFLPLMCSENLVCFVTTLKATKNRKQTAAHMLYVEKDFNVSTELREDLAAFCQAHGIPVRPINIEKIEVLDQTNLSNWMLLVVKQTALSEKIELTIDKYDEFMTDYHKISGEVSKIKCCAHYGSCVCKTYAPSKAGKNVGLYKEGSLLPNGSTIGEMNVECPHCKALHFPSETGTLCCSKGTVYVPEEHLSFSQDELMNDLKKLAIEKQNVYECLRPLNNFLACASHNLRLRKFDTRNEPTIILEGRYDVGLCHLLPKCADEPAFAQLYLADDAVVGDVIASERFPWLQKLPKGLVDDLLEIYKKHNVLVDAYMTMYELYKQQVASDPVQKTKIMMNIKDKRQDIPSDVNASKIHRGRLNAPVFENQVAAIYVCANGEMPTNDELVKGLRVHLRPNKKDITKVPHVAENMDALCYPLFFPRGEQNYIRDRNLFKGKKAKAIKKKAVYLKTAKPLTSDNDDDDDADDDDAAYDDTEKNTDIVSRRKYTLFILQRRSPRKELWHRHRFLGWGKLTAQFVIHQWTRIEADRLESIKKNLTEMRGTKVSSLYKFLDAKLHEKGHKLGSIVSMPTNFVGSNKFYRQIYQNSMTVALEYGNPDLLITVTGNKDWPEIQDNLVHGRESWISDPMLCARVFKAKLDEMIADIIKKQIFGEVVALQYCIEYQKRGMPHAHILLTLKDKVKTAERLDQIISAEIPEIPDKDSPDHDSMVRLHKLVLKHMIHMPCKGKDHLACRQGFEKRQLCKKGFPQPYSDYTHASAASRPTYRRRNLNPVVRNKNILISNADVVPYNRWLLAKYDCHINVMCVSDCGVCKYIYKYIYKGADRLVVEMMNGSPEAEKELAKRTVIGPDGKPEIRLDMTSEYVEGRYISHVEAGMRMLGYPIHYNMHKVITLRSHLPDEQFVCFKAQQDLTLIAPRKSELMCYFEKITELRASGHPNGELTWCEMAKTYIFDKVKRQYRDRQRGGKVLSTLEIVSPKFHEPYAVRLLLQKKSASSFEDLRTVNGVLHDTFVEAAIASGYMQADDEWDNCMAIVSHYGMPPQVRNMFANLLLNCNVINAKELFNKYKVYMRPPKGKSKRTDEQHDQYSLSHIEWCLNLQGSSLEQMGMKGMLLDAQPKSPDMLYDPDINTEFDMGSDPPPDNVVLNDMQKLAFETLFTAVNREPVTSDRVFFLYGKGGCGKSFLLNHFILKCRAQKLKVVAVASTGIAATILYGGRTAHSTFKIPMNLDNESKIAIGCQTRLAQQLIAAKVIIWDEAPMQSRYAMEAVDRLLRDLAPDNRKHLPFGGIMVVFGGDWSQFLPVVTRPESSLEQSTIEVTLKRSELWKTITVLVLDQNMRVAADQVDHMNWLRAVGDGKCQLQDGQSIAIPRSMYCNTEEEIIKSIYTPEVLADLNQIGKVALLSVKNDDTLELNERILNMMPGNAQILESVDEAIESKDGMFGLTESVEYINKQTPGGMPPHQLKVKEGCVVMLLRNIDVGNNLCNGTRLSVHRVLDLNGTKVLQCKHLGSKGGFCYIQRMPLTYSDENSTRSGLAFKRTQFPLRLSFSMTMNKSQGQTFDKVGLILRSPAFTHGSTYVALSRCTSKEGIKVTMNRPIPATQSHVVIRNIVYRDVL